MKALFIPLAGEHFDRFENGSKTHEYRLYGPRWNERVCAIGRAVTLSRGYGKHRRLRGRVTSFERIPFDQAPAAAREIFADRPGDIAKIGVEVVREG